MASFNFKANFLICFWMGTLELPKASVVGRQRCALALHKIAQKLPVIFVTKGARLGLMTLVPATVLPWQAKSLPRRTHQASLANITGLSRPCAFGLGMDKVFALQFSSIASTKFLYHFCNGIILQRALQMRARRASGTLWGKVFLEMSFVSSDADENFNTACCSRILLLLASFVVVKRSENYSGKLLY